MGFEKGRRLSIEKMRQAQWLLRLMETWNLP